MFVSFFYGSAVRRAIHDLFFWLVALHSALHAVNPVQGSDFSFFVESTEYVLIRDELDLANCPLQAENRPFADYIVLEPLFFVVRLGRTS